MQIAVSERMEEVQRNTSANTQATQSTGLRGQTPTTSWRSAPEQRSIKQLQLEIRKILGMLVTNFAGQTGRQILRLLELLSELREVLFSLTGHDHQGHEEVSDGEGQE